MITLKSFLSIAIFNFLAISCSKNDETATTTPTNNEPKAFNAADYSEYFVCKVGDFQYNTGNSA